LFNTHYHHSLGFFPANWRDSATKFAYFTGTDKPLEKLKKALKAEVIEEVWDSLYGTVSRPLTKPETGKIAIKVINHYGDELFKVFTSMCAPHLKQFILHLVFGSLHKGQKFTILASADILELPVDNSVIAQTSASILSGD